MLLSPPVFGVMRRSRRRRGRYASVAGRSNGEGDDEGDGEAQDEVEGGSECNNEAEDHDEGGCEDQGEDECLDERQRLRHRSRLLRDIPSLTSLMHLGYY